MTTRTCATVVAEKRGGRSCPAKAAAALLSEAGLERWQADDIPTSALDEDEIEDVVSLWGLVFAEIEGEGGPAVNLEASEGVAFKIWLKRAVDAGSDGAGKDDDTDDVGGGDDDTKKKKGASKAGGADAEDAFEALAPAVQADLLAQNAKRTSQVGYLNAALHLGYHPSRAESHGLRHGDTATSSEVIRKSSKMPGTFTIVDAIAESEKKRSPAPLDGFVGRLIDSLNSVADDHAEYAPIAAGKISQLYSRVKSTAILEMAPVFFMKEYVLWTCRGRGIPMPMDLEIMARSEKEAAKLAGEGRSGHGGGGGTQSSGGASDGAVMGKLEELFEKFKAVESKVGKIAGIESRLDTLSNKVQNLSKPAGERDKHITCNKCGEKGHRAENCTAP